MSDEIRQERTVGLKDRLNASDRSSLVQLYYSPGYGVLLDLMEMACVAQETRLINVAVDQPESILAEHKMSKAFWQLFQFVQKKVNEEVNIQLQIDDQEKAERQNYQDRDPQQEMLRP